MKKITKAHGSGGQSTKDLIESIFLKHFANAELAQLNDSALFCTATKKIAFTTDSHVVKPIFFPGGDIGKLAVSGTVNDLAVSGAIPKYLSCGFILEEGFEIEKLEKIVISMKKTAKQAGVQIVAGDTKVVEKGEADGIFINTSGIGFLPDNIDLSIQKVKIGDQIILSGNIGEHATAILIARENFHIKTNIKSDCAPINSLTTEILKQTTGIKIMRDPTRGGVATVLNEFVENQNFGIRIFEKNIPLTSEVSGICEAFGFDPLYLANEGKFLCIIAKEEAEKTLSIMQKTKLGEKAKIIGEVIKEPKGKVLLNTYLKTDRIVNLLTDEILPRIC